jgi:hypothetical protein
VEVSRVTELYSGRRRLSFFAQILYDDLDNYKKSDTITLSYLSNSTADDYMMKTIPIN